MVVIDTAPSRQAVDFVTYPERLTTLLGGRSVAWLADLAARAAAPDAPPSRGSLRAWGASHVEALVAKVTGPTLVRDTADLFSDLALVRERFVGLTAHASRLLLGERAAYALVAAPTAAARDDVLFLAARLEALGRAPRAVILNRAEDAPTPHLQLLRDSPGATRAVQQAAAALADERAPGGGRAVGGRRALASCAGAAGAPAVGRVGDPLRHRRRPLRRGHPAPRRAAPAASPYAVAQRLAASGTPPSRCARSAAALPQARG